MAVRFGIVCDLHLGVRQYDTLIQLQEEEKYPYGRIFVVMKALQKWIEKNKIDNLIILGDIFHRKNYTTIPEVFAVKELFDKLVNTFSSLKILLVEGNHDLYDKVSILPLIENPQAQALCSSTPVNTHLFFDLVVKEYKGIIYADNEYFCVLPYTENPLVTEFLSWYEKDKNNTGKFILTHLQFNNTKISSGKILEGISYENLNNTIISGHIHLQQVLEYQNEPKVVYIGSFSQNDFGDAGNFMGGLVIDYSNKGVDEIQLVENDYGIEYITDKNVVPKAKIVLYKLPVSDKVWALEKQITHKVIFVSELKTQQYEKVEIKPLGSIEDDFKEYVISIVKEKAKAKKLLQSGIQLIKEVLKEYGTETNRN